MVTIGQVKEMLDKYPEDAPFVIEDPDTSWIFEVFTLELHAPCVVLKTHYSECSDVCLGMYLEERFPEMEDERDKK